VFVEMSYCVFIVTDLEQVAKNIRTILPEAKSGPMRLWGKPLGRPGEDGHVLIGCEAVNDCLRLKFTDDD
jgi:hypothetical protein